MTISSTESSSQLKTNLILREQRVNDVDSPGYKKGLWKSV